MHMTHIDSDMSTHHCPNIMRGQWEEDRGVLNHNLSKLFTCRRADDRKAFTSPNFS